MASKPSLVGRAISHYRIFEEIGSGGMGVVYRAHDERLDRDVALKVLPVGTLPDDAARKQFRREALALAKLNHPNIATIFDFDCQDNLDFLAMELIPGEPLSTWLRDALREAQGAGFAVQALEARLGLGELDLASGKKSAARAELASVKADATAQGFLLVARKASAALQHSSS